MFLFLLLCLCQILIRIAQCLSSTDPTVRSYALGVIHNLSVDVASISPLIDSQCIPPLVLLLRDCSPEICQASTGTIQNISRDPRSKSLFIECGVIPYLTDLLFSGHVQCQVSIHPSILSMLFFFLLFS